VSAASSSPARSLGGTWSAALNPDWPSRV